MTMSSISWRVCIVHEPGLDLPRQRAVGAEQQLLAGLAAAVEGALDQHAAEGPVASRPPYSRLNGTPCATPGR
jgi:hypothetical protein